MKNVSRTREAITSCCIVGAHNLVVFISATMVPIMGHIILKRRINCRFHETKKKILIPWAEAYIERSGVG